MQEVGRNLLPLPRNTILHFYESGEKRVLDMKPTLEMGGVFASFRDYESFKRVYVDDCHDIAWDIDPNVDSNVVWNNKVDLCPDTCYIDSIPLSEYKAVI